MLCDLRSGPGAFSFKTAFDENFSEFSPGIAVELFNLRNLRKYPQIEWMDSCSSPYNRVISRLWVDRRPLQSVLFSGHRVPYGALISVVPLLQRIRRRFKGAGHPGVEAEPED